MRYVSENGFAGGRFAEVRCRVVCNEGATFDDTLEVEVPERP
jgi:hypothetical protein